MKKAVIDLGTNTFHLLIADVVDHKIVETIYRERIFVKLGAEGVDTLGDKPLARGFEALKKFSQVLDRFGVTQLIAVGTAALRTASNGPEFLRKIKSELGISIKLIDGRREAHLIYLGVRQIWDISGSAPAIIMDIGGGSVEFIIADDHKIYWMDSYPIGVSVLHRKFHNTDPISKEEQRLLVDYLGQFMKPLAEAIQQYQPYKLVGASGTFDVLAMLLCPDNPSLYEVVQSEDVDKIILEIVRSNEKERYENPGIPDSRVDLIVVALLLLQEVLKLATWQTIGISQYALKEGLLVSKI